RLSAGLRPDVSLMRGHFLNYRAVGRLVLFAGIAIAAIVAASWVIRHRYNLLSREAVAAPASRDSLVEQLARCQAIGTAAPPNQACIAAWRENRRRFFRDAR